MKELKCIFVGKAKDFEIEKIIEQTIKNKNDNEKKVYDIGKENNYGSR